MLNPYARDVSHIKTLDPYRLQELYKMHPCAEHVVKKLLVAGEREGGKDLDHDIGDCIRTLTRWQEMRKEDARQPFAAESMYDWGIVPDEFSWLASDMNGDVIAYKVKPSPAEGADSSKIWCYKNTGPNQHVLIRGLKAPKCLWRDSLEVRP